MSHTHTTCVHTHILQVMQPFDKSEQDSDATVRDPKARERTPMALRCCCCYLSRHSDQETHQKDWVFYAGHSWKTSENVDVLFFIFWHKPHSPAVYIYLHAYKISELCGMPLNPFPKESPMQTSHKVSETAVCVTEAAHSDSHGKRVCKTRRSINPDLWMGFK